ncbi:MAG: SMP-30/gluconolactonase/LRE family protein, partial [Verrucomicrobiota bacterium]
ISLTFDQAGNFYVANNWSVFPLASYYPSPTSGDNIIEKFSANYADLGIYVTNLNQPWGLAFDKAGALYIANSGTAVLLKNSILKVTADGSRQVFASSIRGLNQPRGIAFDSSGNLFVANSGAGNILKFTPAGAVSVFASGLNLPTSIAIYPGLNGYTTTPVQLINTTRLTNGAIQLNLSEPGGLTFGVLAATNATMPLSNWTTIGSFNEVSAGQYQFTDTQATNSAQQFYRAKLQ